MTTCFGEISRSVATLTRISESRGAAPAEIREGEGAQGWGAQLRKELSSSGATSIAADEILRSLGSRPTPTLDAALTKAERHVARLVADGLSNAEIAAHLVVSRRTVESHLVRIFRKCGIKNRTQLARLPLGDGRS